MFLFHPIRFVKFLVKSQRKLSYKKGSYKKKSVLNGTVKIGRRNNLHNLVLIPAPRFSSKQLKMRTGLLTNFGHLHHL